MGRPSLILTRRWWSPRARASTLRAASRAPTTRSAHEALNRAGRSALSSDQSPRSHTWTSREVKSVQDRPIEHGQPSPWAIRIPACGPSQPAQCRPAPRTGAPRTGGSPVRSVSDRSVWAVVLAASNPDAETCRTAVRSSTLVGPGSRGLALRRFNPSTTLARLDGRSAPSASDPRRDEKDRESSSEPRSGIPTSNEEARRFHDTAPAPRSALGTQARKFKKVQESLSGSAAGIPTAIGLYGTGPHTPFVDLVGPGPGRRKFVRKTKIDIATPGSSLVVRVVASSSV